MAKQKNDLVFPTLPQLDPEFKLFRFLTTKTAALIIVVLGLLFYAPSIKNEYALDDGIIIHQNDHVLKGVRGIKDILTLDAYESFYRRMCATDQLAGGRYRPLSVVSFALEQEVLGTYRTGLYYKIDDSNHNNVYDNGKVRYISPCGRPEENYEYNAYIDRNGDQMVQANECNACWDRNGNFANDREEDLNSDGIFNEVDCQLYGATFRHFNNIWLYALGCLLLYLVFSKCFFRQNQDLAFLSALLFTIHPIHSEAVANVKSRDETFSLIFISLTFIYAFRFIDRRRYKELLLAGFCFLLSLLSKEYAVMLLALVPLSIFMFTNNNFNLQGFKQNSSYRATLWTVIGFVVCAVVMTYIKRDFDVHALPGAKPVRSFWLMVPLYGAVLLLAGILKKKDMNTLIGCLFLVMLVYVGMRWMAVKLKPGIPNNEILNNPFLLADGEERFCTKGYILLKYIILLAFPKVLSSDYSFDTIAFRHFLSWDFIFSMLLHAVLLFGAIWFTIKKHVLGFAIVTYILFMLMIGNVLMDIGATMGERLIFHASIGFCIALAWTMLKVFQNLNKPAMRYLLLSGVMAVVLVFSCKITWQRCLDWKNDITLFLRDVQTNPNSVLCLGNAGARYVDLLSTEDFSVTTPKGYDPGFNDQNGTLSVLEDEVKAGKFKNLREAGIHHGIEVLTHALELHPRYVNGYLNLGLLYFQLRQDFPALYNLKNAERLYPNNPYLMNYYGAYSVDLKNRAAFAIQRNRWDSAAVAYNLLTILEPRNAEAWYNLGGAYFNTQRYEKARKSWNNALMLKPDYVEVKQLMTMLPVAPINQPLSN